MRKAGILMPISSLPSPYGIGTLGAEARKFVDFLAAGGQSCWQVLPLGPTSYGDSPYQSFSSFAGNPYFIDLDTLAEWGLLEPGEYESLDWGGDQSYVDYEALYRRRFGVLRLAVSRLSRGDRFEMRGTLWNADWLEDYALFMALKDRYSGRSWLEWPEELRLRKSAALDQARAELDGETSFWKGVQYLFFSQWWTLKEYANQKGVSIIGDLPIYVALDSADVWAGRSQFQLDGEGWPTEVAGCPPDAFTADGQLWGNPLFNWERMREEGYAWWLKRIAWQFQLYDTLRIDHFRGFDAYYAIPYGDKTARNGRWRPGPGIEFFKTVNRALGKKDIIAEDLGFLTPSVHKLLRNSGYPGMKVLQFAFDDKYSDSDYLPHRYPAKCVVYAGTHDNDTVQGWLALAPRRVKSFARDYLRLSRREGYHWGVMRAAWASPADLAVMQLQDVLGLGSEARMNIPSTLGNNWKWRALPGACNEELAQRLYQEMRVYQRLPKKPVPRAKRPK
ncbi:4-alpha-glucanotransferase [Colidextribacter sp. OB.20]|nr:4-alpha-glucanotransferase [Colidextribacter sp. OB.20]